MKPLMNGNAINASLIHAFDFKAHVSTHGLCRFIQFPAVIGIRALGRWLRLIVYAWASVTSEWSADHA